MDLSEVKLPTADTLPPSDSLFERCYWLYALFREYVFRDQTSEIVQALFGPEPPPAGTHVLELGCGPGFYARRLAKLFPQIRTTGVDLSKSLIGWAKSKAESLHLRNCFFYQGDAQALPPFEGLVDAVVVSRLFLIVRDKEAVLSEIFRVLRPGGRCFVAEPLAGFTTRLPLSAMWLLMRLTSGSSGSYSEPKQAEVMFEKDFRTLVHSQPWASVSVRCDGRYQYAVCAKSEIAGDYSMDTQSRSAA